MDGGGSASLAGCEQRSMSPTGGFYSFAPAPVVVKNSFAALADNNAIDSFGAVLDRSEDYNLQLFVKAPLTRNQLKKKRRGRRALSSTSRSASTSSGQIYSAPSHSEKSENIKRPIRRLL